MNNTQNVSVPSREEPLGGAYPSAIHRRGKAGETALSLALANAAMNGISLGNYCQDFDINFRDLLYGGVNAIQQLARLTGTAIDDLLWHTPHIYADRTFTLCGITFPKNLLLQGRIQVCPACLLEDETIRGPNGRHIRSHWHLAALRRCHVHNILFETITINSRASDVQDELRAWLPSNIKPAVEGHTALQDYILGHLSDTGLKPLNYPLHVVIGFSEALGALQTDLQPPGVASPPPNDLIKSGAAGFGILSKGDDAILDAMRVLTVHGRRLRNPL